MRKALDLDHLFENAVATALGLDRPHPDLPDHIRPSRRRAIGRRHHTTVPSPRHEHRKVAA
jgi:hypothetical protein